MLLYSLKCRQKTDSKNSRVAKTNVECAILQNRDLSKNKKLVGY